MSLASVALDVQMDLLRWVRTTHGTKYANSVCNAMLGLDVQTQDNFGARLHEVVLIDAMTYAVDREICDLIDSAAQTIPSFAIKLSDIPSSGGFIYFERPIIVPDSKEKDLVVKAMAWHLARPSPDVEDHVVKIERRDPQRVNLFGQEGIVILLWTDPNDPRDHLYEDWLDTKEIRSQSNATWPPYISMLGGTWNFDEEPHNPIGKLLLTFLRFIQERWVDNRRVVADRPAMRRAQRVRPVEPTIKVIRLRRSEKKKSKTGDSEPQEWSRRWIVHPHWRNQWYPKLGEHRPKFIWAYIKGPEDKPLIIDDTVFVVDR